MYPESTVFVLADDASLQRLDEETVVLKAGSGALFSLNETSEAFLSRVDSVRTLGAIVDDLCAEFDVERATLLADMRELARQLIEEGILVEGGSDE
jgi:Coenzyme PQQ synthesis protein D (PqqD)